MGIMQGRRPAPALERDIFFEKKISPSKNVPRKNFLVLYYVKNNNCIVLKCCESDGVSRR